MTNDEIEIVLANTIHEINRLSSSVENTQKVLGEFLGNLGLSPADRAHLKGLLAKHRTDAQSHVLFEAGKTIRRRFEKEQTAPNTPLFRAKKSGG
jgi:hypothetical protein